MAKHQGPYDESIIQMSYTPYETHDSHNPEALIQRPKSTPEHGQPQASNKKWKMPILAGISLALKPWGQTILLTSSVLAVLVDPLFFYIPYTSEERKCMGRDKQVQTAALILRSVTDIPFLVHIIYQLYVAITFALSTVTKDETLAFDFHRLVSRDQMIQAFCSKLSRQSFLAIHVLSILPMPQLLIELFFNIGGNNYKRESLSGLFLVHYLPRIFRVYLLSRTTATSKLSELLVKVTYNFFLYILACHVLGSFWYFSSVQREITCWYQNCIDTKRSESECTFYCHSNITAALITPEFNKTLNDQCILKVPWNMTDPPFDFGMFSDVFKNDIQGKINFPQKIGYCLWWGLRNVSAFGSSLETSSYLGETIFAMFISITGLLLVSIVFGNNLQSYMEMKTRAKEVREKIREKWNDIENWMENWVPEADMKEEIMKIIMEKLEEDISADLDDIYSILPRYTKNDLKRFVGMRTLRNVPMLSNVDGRVLKMICDYLQPVKFQEDTMVFRMGEPFDRMVFIVNGSMWTYKTATESGCHSGQATGGALATSSSTEAHFLKKGDAYGHMLLQLASSSRMEFPISVANVKCDTKVEAFVLMARDLKEIVTACGKLWPASFNNNAAASQDQVAVSVGQSQQQQNLKERTVATSNINHTGHNE